MLERVRFEGKPLTQEVGAVIEEGLRLVLKPEENRVWIQTVNRWSNAYPLFEFLKRGLDIQHGRVVFDDPSDRELFLAQFGHKDDPPELFPGIVFPDWIVQAVKTRKKEMGKPIWFIDPDRDYPLRVNILDSPDLPYYREWSVATIHEDPESSILYNPVRVGRADFQRSPEYYHRTSPSR